jgi:hypothetical protein
MLSFDEFVAKYSTPRGVGSFAWDDELLDMLDARPAVASWDDVPQGTLCFVYEYGGPRILCVRSGDVLWRADDGKPVALLMEVPPDLTTVPSRDGWYVWTAPAGERLS